MSQQQIKWGQLKRFFDRNGFDIHPSGGDKIITCLSGWNGGNGRRAFLIGHKCCSHAGNVVFDVYMQKLRRTFGVTREGILRA